MHELFLIEGQSIYTFKAGDIVYRTKNLEIKRQVINENLGIAIEVTEIMDSSYRNEPLEFICIKNNLAYFKKLKSDYRGKPDIRKLALPEWEDNWAIYEIPEGLTLEDCL